MIYFIQADGIGHIKIGFTDGEDAESRLANLQTGSPVPLRVLHTMPGTLEDEKKLHRKFAAHGVGGEWFKAVPDLLALIPATNRKACEGKQISTRTVSINVLTVGRKQFSKALLNQLPHEEILAWDIWARELVAQGYPTYRSCPQDMIKSVLTEWWDAEIVWGWVKETEQPWGRYLVFQLGDRLCKQHDPRVLSSYKVDAFVYEFARDLHRWWSRFLPGTRDQDQLFIGV